MKRNSYSYSLLGLRRFYYKTLNVKSQCIPTSDQDPKRSVQKSLQVLTQFGFSWDRSKGMDITLENETIYSNKRR